MRLKGRQRALGPQLSYFRRIDAAGAGNTRSICRVGLGAVTDVPQFDHFGSITQLTGSIAEKGFLLFGRHKAEELAGLFVIISVIAGIRPVIGIAVDLERRFGRSRLLLPRAVTVGFIIGVAAIVAVYPHLAVAVAATGREYGRRSAPI